MKHSHSPVKVSVGAGPAVSHVYFEHYKDAKDSGFALAPIFNKEMKDLVAAGAKYLQFQDLGAWLPLFTGERTTTSGFAKSSNSAATAWTQRSAGTSASVTRGATTSSVRITRRDAQTVLPCYFGTAGIDEWSAGLRQPRHGWRRVPQNIPANQGAQIGVLDIRTNAIERPETIAARIKKVVAAVPADKGHAEFRLRSEAPCPHGGEDEAQCAGRGRRDCEKELLEFKHLTEV